ncbi:peptide chain release factor N(5)-glutamine methyltransferase [Mariniplasma anaerobium]|uniref:peptide chain release factor N(5)-glutamine methyltransferase n=1 Tax=Mariniplasma anaerobium TaxID=2735436 RepID=A0A7U9TIL6_9MOLU|nr:peptide chain release factor N(5)-glutamine methyltransferase [Mariniplasma anaerobium]BCR35435.1 release factor glutamine methyltransferase [Mariniplasma anaerobium]
MTYEQLLRDASKKALEKDKEIEAVKLLLMELSHQDPHEFYLNLKNEVDETFKIDFINKLNQYILQDIPVQHLIGHAYFYGHAFDVSKDVLIPRSETERLVEEVLYLYDTYFDQKEVLVLDLGTGSGCIGITLALEESHMKVSISDISLDALKIASKNKDKLKADVSIIHSDLFKNINQKFDIIVSNPPYIPDEEALENIVKKEPDVALFGGQLGVDFYEKILKDIKPFLKENSLIAFEHGYMQKDVIRGFAQKHLKEATIVQKKDLQQKDRFTFIGFGDVLK